MHPTIQLIAVSISALAIFGAFAAWLVRHMDRHMDQRFDEARADMQRQLDNARADTDRRFDEAKADMNRRFDEAEAKTQRQFAEAKADTQRGFDRVREDFQRLESKLDAHSEQTAVLRQDVGRLQGIVERTYEPARFTVPPARMEKAAAGVAEAPASYDAGAGGEDPERNDEP